MDSGSSRMSGLGRLRPPDLGVHISGVGTKARSRQAFRLKGVEYEVSLPMATRSQNCPTMLHILLHNPQHAAIPYSTKTIT